MTIIIAHGGVHSPSDFFSNVLRPSATTCRRDGRVHLTQLLFLTETPPTQSTLDTRPFLTETPAAQSTLDTRHAHGRRPLVPLISAPINRRLRRDGSPAKHPSSAALSLSLPPSFDLDPSTRIDRSDAEPEGLLRHDDRRSARRAGRDGAVRGHDPAHRGELPGALHRREGGREEREAAPLQGLQVPPGHTRLHVPGNFESLF